MAQRRLRVLFTEGSSTSARQALYALGPRHAIDILDPNPLCQCRFSRFVRRRHAFPPFSREPRAYLERLCRLLETQRYDVLLPTHEQVFLLARFRKELAGRVALAVPDFDSVNRMMSKAHFVRLCDELGVGYPETRIVRTRAELLRCEEFPVFVKVDYSTAGEGVRRVETRDDLLLAADAFERAGWLDGRSEILVQRLAAGRKGGASGVFQHGRLVAAHCCQGRALGVGGSSMAQESVNLPGVMASVERIGRHLGWHGAMVLEFFHEGASGRTEFIECNPRIGETLNALAAGVNFPEQLVRVSLGEEVEPQLTWRSGVLTHQGFLVLMARALDGAGRRQLLSELWQNFRRRGIYAGSSDELTRPGDDWPSALPFLGVTALLLARPRAAQWLVSKTVGHYALHSSAIERILEMPV